MKKRVISLVGIIIMMLNVICPVAFAEEEVIENSFPLADYIGSEKYASANSLGFEVLENEKYLLIAEGTHPSAFANMDIHLNDKIHIYEKPNSEHLDYKFLTTIKVDSNSANYDVPARDIYLYGDTLFVFWGNAMYAKNAAGYYPAGTGSSDPKSTLMSYDLSDIEVGEVLAGTYITQGDKRTAAEIPFTRGGIAYLDEEEGILYRSKVTDGSYDAREYHVTDASAPTVVVKSFKTDTQGKNAVQFIVKDGYLYEMLQQEAGNTEHNGDATLVDADGNAINNTITVYDLESALEICNNLTAFTGIKSIKGYKRGTYTTETAGDYVMQDIDVYDDYVYIATTNGLEYVNTTASKEAESLVTLSLAGKILDGVDVKGISIFGTDLYLGTDSDMQIYDISAGAPSLKATYTLEGGFCDFEVNEEENAIYAMRNGARGVVVIDKSMLGLSLNVENFTFDNVGAGFSAQVSSESNMSVKSVLLLYKGNKLVDMSVSEWSLSESASTVSDSIETTIEDAVVKVMFVSADETKLIPMVTEEGMEYKKESAETVAVTGTYDSSAAVSELSDDGVITISGNVKDRANKPVLVSVKNSNTDRLNGYSYFDVLNVAENGNYATSFKPVDSGDYTVTLSRVAGIGTTEISGITVPALKVSVPGAVEIPGVEAPIVINAEYAQNVETLDVELSFDDDAFVMPEDVEISEEFELENAEATAGSLTLSFARKSDIKTDSFEFCVIPVEIAQTAGYGDYTIALTVTAKDEFENVLTVETVDGNIELVESTPKYDAMDDAKAALSNLINAEDVDVENYLEEKVKIEDAREKVDYAYSYLVRDSQLGVNLVSNLAASEAKLLEIKPYYDAVDTLNATEAALIGNTLKANKLYFGLTEEMLAVYDEINASETATTDAIDAAMEAEPFVKPSDVKSLFAQTVVLEAFKETSWQSVGTLLKILSDANVIDTSDYDALDYETQKVPLHQNMDYTTYESIEQLNAVLVAEVEKAEGISTTPPAPAPSRPNNDIYIKPSVSDLPAVKPDVPEVPEIPVIPEKTDDAVFNDIEGFDWAKEAILHLYDKGIVSGKEAKKFAPADEVKREEFAKMVVLAYGIEASNDELSFSDVDDNAWYKEYVYTLASTGIIKGREDGSFGVGDYITREEIAVILERVATYKNAELKSADADFNDGDKISSWAESAMKKMFGSGILSGFEDNTVRPNENANRAQIAKIVYTALGLFN